MVTRDHLDHLPQPRTLTNNPPGFTATKSYLCPLRRTTRSHQSRIEKRHHLELSLTRYPRRLGCLPLAPPCRPPSSCIRSHTRYHIQAMQGGRTGGSPVSPGTGRCPTLPIGHRYRQVVLSLTWHLGQGTHLPNLSAAVRTAGILIVTAACSIKGIALDVVQADVRPGLQRRPGVFNPPRPSFIIIKIHFAETVSF